MQRRAGILSGGKGDHVDLGKSWTELGLLAQCTSRAVQEGKRLMRHTVSTSLVDETLIPGHWLTKQRQLSTKLI